MGRAAVTAREWPQYYILVGHAPMAVDMMTWAKMFENPAHRRVAETAIGDKCSVSTIFLGLDHNWRGVGDPVLFETMIFGGPLDAHSWRYTTWNEAERGHAEAVEQASKAAQQVAAIAKDAGALP
jgi:hypothetical protein